MTGPASAPEQAGPAGQRLRWSAGQLIPAGPGDRPDDALVIDSWLVRDGLVRDFAAHSRRFSTAVAGLLPGAGAEAARFMRAVAGRLPAGGRWFPRAELALDGGRPDLRLWLRPAPAPRRAVRLWVAGPDPRSHPAVKGADLSLLARLREQAEARGADEAVLLSPAGEVLEGAATSILWWRAGRLCAPPADGRVLPGVTRSVLLSAAAGLGIPVATETCPPEGLSGLEVWAVNALHGIRPVTGWTGTAARAGAAPRAAAWQQHLAEAAVPARDLILARS